jgi:hypothetical protein
VQQRIDVVRAAIETGESSISTLQTLQGWSGNATRRDLLVKLDGALTTWHKWAAGGGVADVELGNAARIMMADAIPDQADAFAHLADAVTEWAHRFHPALILQLEVEPPAVRPSMTIEL